MVPLGTKVRVTRYNWPPIEAGDEGVVHGSHGRLAIVNIPGRSVGAAYVGEVASDGHILEAEDWLLELDEFEVINR